MIIYYMDLFELLEVACFGINFSVLLSSIPNFIKKRQIMNYVEEAEGSAFGSTRANTLMTESGVLSYTMVSGKVRAAEEPICSSTNPTKTGVIRRLNVIEKYVSTSVRERMESERLLYSSINCVNFNLETNGQFIAVREPMKALWLDLVVVTDRYESRRSTLTDILWEIGAMFHLIPGGRQQGVWLKEEMLLEGETFTGIGELKRIGTQKTQLTLSPPTEGKPFFLSKGMPAELKEKTNKDFIFYKYIVAFTSFTSTILACHVIWRRIQLLDSYLNAPPFEVYTI